jgi:AcrR family transcriptional regulator
MTGSRLGIRPTSEQIDRAILDVTAGLIARRGVKDTAVQAVADATGYSKTGIINRFPSKQRLIAAAVEQCVAFTRERLDLVAGVPYGPSRDAVALEALTDLALERRGWVELALTALPARRDDDLHERLEPLGDLLWQMFVDPDEGCEYLERRARLSGAVGALALLALTYDTRTTAESTRPLILAITWNALGHPGAFRSIPAS